MAAGEELTLDWSCETGGCAGTVGLFAACERACTYWLLVTGSTCQVEPLQSCAPCAVSFPLCTENDREFRHATCLCGSAACRGSFLYLSKQDTSGPLQQVRFGVAW